MWGAEFWEAAARSVAPRDMPLLLHTMGMVAGSRAPSTMKQYVAPWQRFVAFCKERSYQVVPASPLTVAMFLASTEAAAAAAGETYAVVKSASAAVATHYELYGVADSPTKHPLCKAVRQAAKRRLGLAVQNRKQPLPFSVLEALVEAAAPPGAPLHLLMFATYAMVSYAGFLRYDDTSKLQVQHVRLFPDRTELTLVSRKNDQFRHGSVVHLACGASVACPVALLRRYLAELGGEPASPLFRDWDGHKARTTKRVVVVPLKPGVAPYEKLLREMRKWLAKLTGLPTADVQERFGLHSLRSGGATAAAAGGVEERLFQAHGGWRSRGAMLPYVQESMEAKLSVSAALGY